MRKLNKLLVYFVSGFLLMACLQMLTQCNHDNDFLKNSISKDEIKDEIDYESIAKAKDQIQAAMSSADESALNELIVDDFRTFYQNSATAYTTEEMTAIGEAMKKAKLSSATANFAEYSYKIDRVEYTFNMVLDEDGTWKISNF